MKDVNLHVFLNPRFDAETIGVLCHLWATAEALGGVIPSSWGNHYTIAKSLQMMDDQGDFNEARVKEIIDDFMLMGLVREDDNGHWTVHLPESGSASATKKNANPFRIAFERIRSVADELAVVAHGNDTDKTHQLELEIEKIDAFLEGAELVLGNDPVKAH